MKEILFIAPDYYGFNEVVHAGFKQYSGMEVTHTISAYTQPYQYKNFLERAENFFMKLFLNRNLKNEKQYAELRQIINNSKFYDQIIINRPDTLSTADLIKLKQKTNTLKAFFWDSIDKIKTEAETISYFDVCYSFDAEDCKKYGFHKNHNFFFADPSDTSPIYDMLFWGTEDSRVDKLILILNHLNAQGHLARAILYNNKIKKDEVHPKSPYITRTQQLVPFSESYKVSRQAKILIDLAQNQQRGLSFRPFEAMGMQKKLITDNTNILSYDFYNPKNICLINPNHIMIPNDFLTTPYEPLQDEIRQKYTLKSWIQNLIAN